jgi:hypothetical protein
VSTCRHPQADTVVLSTGEVAACVCVGCFAELPADYIDRQLQAAHLQATCSHEDAEYVMTAGSAIPVRKFCTECSASSRVA